MKSGEVLLADVASGRATASSEMRELNPALSRLRRVVLFAELDDLTLAELASKVAPSRHYRKGEHILQARGVPTDSQAVSPLPPCAQG